MSRTFEVLTYDGDDLRTFTVHGRYRWRWLAEWMSRGVMRYRPTGAYVTVRQGSDDAFTESGG